MFGTLERQGLISKHRAHSGLSILIMNLRLSQADVLELIW